MLERLYIKNVALIDKLELEFSNGLNILSGETGAGKSIIIDCIMLLMGNRFDSTLLRFGTNEGIVEGVFSYIPDEIFEECGVEKDEIAIITRKFNTEGKNEIRINGRSATLGMLKKFSSYLLDIYGQNESQYLFDSNEQFQMLDNYIGTALDTERACLKELLRTFNDIKRKIKDLGDDSQRKRNMDLLQYQIEEIEKAAVRENEEEELVERRKLLLSSEKISETLQNVLNALHPENLYNALKQLSQIASLSDNYASIYERLHSLSVEFEDIEDSIMFEQENASFEEDEMETLEDRLGKIREIKRKYGEYKDMLRFWYSAKERYDFLSQGAENYSKLVKQYDIVSEKIMTYADKMSDIRKTYAENFENEIISQLESLGMPSSRFEIHFSEPPDSAENVGEDGYDNVEFYLSTNPGYPLRPLAKIISGGEASRFMLALKAMPGNSGETATMIFDEIDAGISGKTGQVVAQKLADIASKHQVICITHLASIAAMADRHFFISKEIKGDTTLSHVELLDEDQSISEISRLLGAKDISEQSELSAKQMKIWGDNYKNLKKSNG